MQIAWLFFMFKIQDDHYLKALSVGFFPQLIISFLLQILQ